VGGICKKRKGSEELIRKERGGRNWYEKEGVEGIYKEKKGWEELIRKERSERTW
jgi:hypothetical protein